MKTENTILLIGAAIAGYLLLAGKGQSEGGTGGSLITPAYPDWSSGATAPVSSTPVSTTPISSAPINWNDLVSSLNPFVTESGKGNVSFSASAYATKKATDPTVEKFLGYIPETSKSIVSLPAWMGGSVFTENVNKLKSEGYSYEKMSPTGEFTFSKKITETKKAASVAAPSTGLYGYQSGAGGGYGGIAASGGSAGASGYRSSGSGSWTSAGYTTRY